MRIVAKLAAFQLVDVLRSRWLFGYAIFFLLTTEGLLRFGGDATRALVSLTSIVLFIVPLAAIVFATVYVHRAREFIELLLAQPVGRSAMFAGTYGAMAVSLSAGLVVGVGTPFVLRGGAGVAGAAAVLVGTGVALTLVFAGAGVALALRTDDRLRAFGLALGAWACTALAYDAVMLVLATAMAGAPLERPLLAATFANPIDLARVVMLMHLDISALMGYTGASFTRFFDASSGTVIAAASLAAWAAGPALLGARLFRRKDF
jgi:Cu-processing system permease protein